jgi:hypothetical protein
MFKLFGKDDEQVLVTLARNEEGLFELMLSFDLGDGEAGHLVKGFESNDPEAIEKYCREQFDAMDEEAATETRAMFFRGFTPEIIPLLEAMAEGGPYGHKH